jgi:hypothetical protein
MARKKKTTEEQMEMFEVGGLKDEGGTVDPVSGNDVPPGSTQTEVRDDIPAQLSEGEFVLPADVVRYIGLENLMQLRSKAKQGLAKMESMGQMGNSEEATMDDDLEYSAEIDALIDSFDPNDPSTMEFAQGGVVKAANGYFAQPQQFSYGYMPPGFAAQQVPATGGVTYRAPQIPRAQSFVTGSGQMAGSTIGTTGTQERNVEQRQYIGPNGELITIMFINGVPQQKIPEGYKVYKPEEVKPEVTQPEITSPGSSGDDRERDQQRQDEYNGYVSEMSQLAELNDKVAEKWNGSPHNPKNQKGFTDAFGNFIKSGGPIGAIKADYDIHQTAQQEAPTIAEQYGLDINDYKNKGITAVFSDYNTDALARDAITAKAVAESLGMDPRDLARTNIDSDGDGKISAEEAKKAEADLFMDLDDGTDPADTSPAPSGPQGDPYDEPSSDSGSGFADDSDPGGGTFGGPDEWD